MPYTKQGFKNGQVLNAQELINMEDGIIGKMERYVIRLVKSGNTYSVQNYNSGATLSFADLKTAISNTSNYVVCVYGNSKLRPQYVSASEMMFIGVDRASTEAKVLRMLVTPSYVQYETYPLASSDDVEDLGNEITRQSTEIFGLKEENEALKKYNKQQDRKIDTLYKLNEGITFDYQTDDEEAYSKDVLTGAKVGDLLSIGGKSVVMNQLVPPNAIWSSTQNGVTLVNNNGAISASGTASATCFFNSNNTTFPYIFVVGHKYYLRGCPSGGDTSKYRIDTNGGAGGVDIGDGHIFTYASEITDKSIRIRIASGQNCDGLVFRPQLIDLTQMFGSGNEPTLEECQKIFTEDYYPYNAGEIVSADVESVVVRGKNIFDKSVEITHIFPNSLVITNIRSWNSISIDVSGIDKLVLSVDGSKVNRNDSVYYFFSQSLDIGSPTTALANMAYTTSTRPSKTIETNGYKYLTISVWEDLLPLFDSIQLERGTVTTPYSPYKSEPIPLPSLDLKSAGTAHDYVERRTYKNMKSVDLGELSWQMTSSYAHRVFYCNLTDATNTKNQLTELCNIGTSNNAQTFANNSIDNSISKCEANQQLFIRCDSYTTVVDFKNAMKGIILHYEATEGGEDYDAVVKVENVLKHDDITTCTFSLNPTTHVINVDMPTHFKIRGTERIPNLLMRNYVTLDSSGTGSVADTDMSVSVGNTSRRIYVHDNRYTTVEEFKTALSGESFIYELQTPRIYDITNQWNIEPFECETGGTITFTQDDIHLPIPNSEKYLVSLKEANA